MAIGITLKISEYILECDKKLKPEEQTIFTLKPLSAKEYAEAQDNIIVDKSRIKNFSSYSLEVLRLGLKGWKNFRDQAGVEIPFSEDIDENINWLDISYRYELSTRITELSSLPESKKKN